MKETIYVQVKGTVPKNLKYLYSPKKRVLFINASLTPAIVVVLKFPTKWLERQKKLHEIYDGIHTDEHGFFATGPTDPTLPNFLIMVNNFDDAMRDVAIKKPNAVDNRKPIWYTAYEGAQGLCNYVQKLCRLDPANAETMAADAHMVIKGKGHHGKQKITGASTRTGEVDLKGLVQYRRQATEWVFCGDLGDPANWNLVRVPPTLAAETTITGLISGKEYYFKSRVISKYGPGQWSDVITVRVK